MIEYHVVPFQLSGTNMTPNELHLLRVLCDMAKASRKDLQIGKAYTDRDFARDYLDSNFTMVGKVLTGNAKSQKVISAIKKFIDESGNH